MAPADAGAACPPVPVRAITVSDHLCIDFVNSRFADHTGGGRLYDRLEVEGWRRWFLTRCGLSDRLRFDAQTRQELVGVRGLLRRLLESGHKPGDHDVAQLNRYLVGSSLWWKFTRAGQGFDLSLRWNNFGWPALMAAVTASYARLVVDGGIERVHVCTNPDCSFMFYEDSRNGSRRWCDVTICGNLIKVRRRRAALHALSQASRRGRRD
jgi:predicted RNA-binding Zn ribbon-like protein